VARYHLFIVLLRMLGVFFAVFGVGELGGRVYMLRQYEQTNQHPYYLLLTPLAYIGAAPVLIFAAPFIARLCGERKPPP
jgi:hypothetical protein